MIAYIIMWFSFVITSALIMKMAENFTWKKLFKSFYVWALWPLTLTLIVITAPFQEDPSSFIIDLITYEKTFRN